MNMVKNKDTIIDTLFILGPTPETTLADMAKRMDSDTIDDFAAEINQSDSI